MTAAEASQRNVESEAYEYRTHCRPDHRCRSRRRRGLSCRRSDSRPPPEPVAQLQTDDVLVAKADIGPGQNSVVGKTATLNQVDISPDDGARRGNINAVRYGIANPTAIQK